MKDSLVSSLKFTKIRDYELAWVEATVSLDDKSDYHIKEKNNNNAENNGNDDNDDVEMSTGNNLELRSRTPLAADQLPVLSLPTGPIGQHKTVFVNEPKLSDVCVMYYFNSFVIILFFMMYCDISLSDFCKFLIYEVVFFHRFNVY